ncbi:ATP-dependent protease La domain protein [Perilla frutescens var. hirtella]|uniref:ATP-dependent protease La domain protein n=1 Tax=Perilla frutescens var. hirtella TaxID=608512 RepID=A0AAD4P9Y3_PERFH|nr:ATP-dependent protease La domain protein [Perilla frutescens var. hirtella]
MEDDPISESERLQIEQIMELEDEELEVEEVEDEESSDDEYLRESAGASASGEYTYDTSLVTLHSYLGDVEDTHSRLAFLDGGAVLTLPLFYLEGVVLFPEATLPLRVVFPNFIAGVERAMGQADARYTIGVVRVYRDPSNGRVRLSTTGTTAEIRQYRRLEDGSVNIVARGQQRFRLKRRWIDVEGSLCGEVHIIQEDVPLRTPREAVGKLAPLRNSKPNSMSCTRHSCEEGNDSDAMSEGSFESELSSAERRLHHYALVSSRSSEVYDDSISSDDERSERFYECQSERYPLDNYTRPVHLGPTKQNADDISRVGKRPFPSYMQPSNKVGWGKHSLAQLRDVPKAFWPGWVYRMYDSYVLARKAADRWKQVVKAPNMDSLVMKPDLLSFHIASKIPISDTARQELLEIDGTTYRLRKEIELLESFDKIRCKTCQTLIAKRSDMLVMSSDGPLGAYANPHGYVHEVMTLTRTSGIAVTGPPVKEYSWFPGRKFCAFAETLSVLRLQLRMVSCRMYYVRNANGLVLLRHKEKKEASSLLGHKEFTSGGRDALETACWRIAITYFLVR